MQWTLEAVKHQMQFLVPLTEHLIDVKQQFVQMLKQ